MQGVPPAGFTQHILDTQVDAMIAFADLDKDGMVTFEEYKKIIQAGCSTEGGRQRSERRGPARPSADVIDEGTTIHL